MRVEETAEESKDGISVFNESTFSIDNSNIKALSKQDCMKILQIIIAVKREQTFCSVEDSQIFMKNYIHHTSSKKSSETSMSGSVSKKSKASMAA